jgi:hypothetical protein
LKGRGFSRAEEKRQELKGTGFSPYINLSQKPGFSPRGNALSNRTNALKQTRPTQRRNLNISGINQGKTP